MTSTRGAIEARVRRQRVDAARLSLLERAERSTLKDLLTATLDLAEGLTGSRIGYFHFVDEDQRGLWLQAWSTNTVARMCTAEGAGQHYPLDRAGVWADCVRLGRPVVHNDYASLEGKKGLPPGHAPVVRELNVPVVRANRICAVLGVGNKPSDYDERDVEDVAALADLAWDIAARKRAEEALRRQDERLELAAISGGLGLWDLDLSTNEAWRTLQHDRLFGYEELQPSWGPEQALRHVVPEDRPVFEQAFTVARSTGHFHYELRIRPNDRPLRWIEADGQLFRDAAGTPVRMMGIVRDVTERKRAEEELRASLSAQERLVAELRTALGAVRTLSGLLPICMYCKKIRDDQGYWAQVESYISSHTDALFTHGMCEECYQKHKDD